MERLGSILKERRRELSLSLEDVSKKTKLSTVQLNAIESGNIQFFKEDLSYLGYFVRYYSNALNLEYDEIRELLDQAIDEYSETLVLSEMERKQQINESVMKNRHQAPKGIKPRIQKKSRIDYKAALYFVLAILIVAILVYAFFNNILPALNSDPAEKPIVVTPPKEKDEVASTDDKNKPEGPVKEVASINVKMVNPNSYEITGWEANEPISIDVKFANRSWIQVSQDDSTLAVPQSRIYEAAEVVKVNVSPQNDRVIEFNMGYMAGNDFYINDVKVSLDPSVAASQAATVIEFKFVGGQNQ